MSKSRRSAEKEAFWRLALAEHRQSGLPVRDFCSREGLSTATFYAWKRTLRVRDVEASRAPQDDQAELIPVEVVASLGDSPGGAQACAPPLEVVTPSGYTLRFPATIEPCQLGAVLAAVAESSGAGPC